MSSKTKNTASVDDRTPVRVPQLRFPEFRRAAGWKFLPLNHLAIRIKQKNRDEHIDRVLTNSAEFGVIDQRDFFDKDIATQGKLEGYFVVELGSYVYNPRISSTAPVGPISKNKIGTGVMSPLYTVFKFKDDRNEFYEQFFKTTGWHNYMRRASSTGARHDRMAISNDDFMAMPLPVSSPDEQQKIADCLSSLDELIAAQGLKVNALKAKKKSLMQQLFPGKGETQPRLRFPEYRNTGTWKQTKLGSHITIQSGNSPSRFKLSSKGKYPFVKVEDLNNCIKYQISGREFCENTAGVVPEKSILFPKRGAAIELNKIRITAVEIFIDTNLMALVPKNDLKVEFLYYYLSNIGLSHIADSSTIPQINNKHIMPFDFLLPVEGEQQRIVDCLSCLDDYIAAQSRKHEAVKMHKKGLMQKLFPTKQEVEA